MTFDGIAAIQARIDAIQQQFGAATASSGGSGASGSTANPDFAQVLAQVSANSSATSALGLLDGSSSDPTSSASSGSGTGGLDPSLLSALTGSSANTGGLDPSLLSALTGSSANTGGLDPSLLSALSNLTGRGGMAPPAPSSTAPTGFVATALAEAGKPYRFGAEASPNDPNPPAFDCSELVQWAAARNGVNLVDGAAHQYLAAKQAGEVVPVDVAIRTPGALLFSFSSEPVPGQGEPPHAHVAISLGDGRTIEAKGRAYGVGVFSAANRFTYGAIVPGLAR